MFQELVDTRQGLHRMVHVAAFVVFVHDLSSGGAALAWTYNYSTIPSRRWPEARQWCMQHFTDMVPIRNQEESDFINNLLPFNPRNYWIGIVKKDGKWIWQETSEKVPKKAQNWAPEEPDNIADQDCVEMYVKREKDTAKWNNENCHKKKGTVCYTTSCRPDSCSANADCVETIGNYTCQCHPGFLGSRCEEAITCKPLLDPELGSHNCSHPYGSNRFNSSCSFHCGLGFQLVGVPQLLCQASGRWNHPVPQCQVVQCNSLKAPPNASMQCQDPRGVYSYGSICSVQCEEGFDLIGTNMTQCSSQGNWSHALPVCQAKRCKPINPPYGSLNCSDPNGSFSFGSRCTTTCDDGFLLNGTASTECTSLGMWSADIPNCLGKKKKKYLSGSVICLSLYLIQFYHISIGLALFVPFPAKRCPTVNSSSHGSLVCIDPHGEFSFGTWCTSTCEEGFLLNGTADIECTSLGTWNREMPNCLAQPCPLLASAPQHGRMNCSHPYTPFSYGSHCDFDCDEGFWLKGTQTVTCNNSGHWSQELPTCQPVQCESIRALSSSLSMNCSHPLGNFSFGSQCLFTCDEGFSPNGTDVLLCSSTGFWNASLPTCTGMPVGWTAILLSTGLRAVYVVVLLILIALAVAVIMRFKKGNTVTEPHAPAWGDKETPAFDFKT
ncbi:E-selectin isoform X1 [Etheostoma spectabile]|uniref:E-selectin isoform X1 n=1 Tax=Etheostoma spectabile TaxID=54343 RepID=UPI0013AF30F3|nr:E-selectin-like isoform X1 [Etheostoma spectabile]